MRSRLLLFKLELQQACYFYFHPIMFLLIYWHVLSLHLILPVKACVVFKSLNVVCKQTTCKNVKRDIGCRENMTIETQRFTIVCSRCLEKRKCGYFTLFCGGRHEVILKCVPHVQQAYFSSFNQLNSYFFWRCHSRCHRES